MGARAEQHGRSRDRRLSDRAAAASSSRSIRRCSPGYPNIDILNRGQLASLAPRAARHAASEPRAALPPAVRDAAAESQRPALPHRRRSRARAPDLRSAARGRRLHIDPSQLWFALVRPLNADERAARSSPTTCVSTAATRCGRRPEARPISQSRRRTTRSRISSWTRTSGRRRRRSVARSARCIASPAKTSFGRRPACASSPAADASSTRSSAPTRRSSRCSASRSSTNPAEFDYENRLWPRPSDPVFNLGAGAVDVRNGQSIDVGRVIRDQFLVFPSLRPFSARDSRARRAGQSDERRDLHDARRISLLAAASGVGLSHRARLRDRWHRRSQSLTLGATQMRPGSERVLRRRTRARRASSTIASTTISGASTSRGPTRCSGSAARSRCATRRIRSSRRRRRRSPGSCRRCRSATACSTSRRSTSRSRPPRRARSSASRRRRSLMTGVSGHFAWNAPALTRLVESPAVRPTSDAVAHLRSRRDREQSSAVPRRATTARHTSTTSRARGDSTFRSATSPGTTAACPPYGNSLRSRSGPDSSSRIAPRRSCGRRTRRRRAARVRSFTRSQIDPLTDLIGSRLRAERAAALAHAVAAERSGPLSTASTRRYDWTLGNTPLAVASARSAPRSVRPASTSRAASILEFWTLRRHERHRRAKNPTLIFDFGDVSENSLAFAPETLTIQPGTPPAPSTASSPGRSCRASIRSTPSAIAFSHAFNFEVNDTGLPGRRRRHARRDRRRDRPPRDQRPHLPRCTLGALNVLGDPRANCTVRQLASRRRGHRSRQRAELPQTRSARASACCATSSTSAIRAKYKRFGGTLHRFGARERRRAAAHASVGARQHSVQVAHRFAQRRQSPAHARASAHHRVGRGPARRRADAASARRAARDRRAVARSSTTDARRHGGRRGPTAASSSRRTIGTNDSSATLVYQPPPGVIDEADSRARSSARSARRSTSARCAFRRATCRSTIAPRRIFRFPAGAADFNGLQAAARLGTGTRQRLGAERRPADVREDRPRREQLLHVSRADDAAGATRRGVDRPRRSTSVGSSRCARRFRRTISPERKNRSRARASDSADHRRVAAADRASCRTASPRAMTATWCTPSDPAVTRAESRRGAGARRRHSPRGRRRRRVVILPADTLELWVDDIRLDAAGQRARHGAGR